MKKVLFVIALCVSVVIANAQEQKVEKTTKTTTKTVEKTTLTPAKTAVKEAELLQPIKDNIAKDFAGAKIDKALKNDVKGVVTYEVRITKDNAKWTLVYDKEGKFIKKEEMKKPEMKRTEVKKEVKEVKKTEAPKK
jgi:hypothetical protein